MNGRGSSACGLAFLLLVSCSVSGDGETPNAGASSAATAVAEFVAEVEGLCAPVAEEHDRLLEVRDVTEFDDVAEDVAKAERSLAEDLRDVEPPPGRDETLDAYTAALEDYSDAQLTAATGRGGEANGFDDVVRAAKAGVELDELAVDAGLPPSCPPPPRVDVHNTLFAAKANRDCHGLAEAVRSAGPLKTPRTPEEVALALQLGQRLTTGVTEAVERAAGPETDSKIVRRIVRANEKRLKAFAALGETFEEGSYRSYRKTGRKLVRISRKADEAMLSVGLVSCVKAFAHVPL